MTTRYTLSEIEPCQELPGHRAHGKHKEIPARTFLGEVHMLRRVMLYPAVLTLALSVPSAATAQASELAAFVDSIAAEYIDAGTLAGMSVGVTRGSETLLMSTYGLADMEWDVPMPVNAIHQIGSITKQFTTVAALMLWEQGELDLDADLTEYLPDFDTQGRAIPVRRLFDHTSGIKGYTEMPMFGRLMTQSLPRDSLVTLFSAEPFDFEPGTAEIYNNSAFFLLGLVIEEVSGQSYEDFLEEHVFPKASMDDSSYCSNSTILAKRAHGYQASADGLQLAPYLDHTWPYAAGSLCSTVGDLILWNRALHGGQVLGDEAYQMMITPAALVDGTVLRYAMGISQHNAPGGWVIEHGGGINGFLSQSTYYPEEDAIVIVLVNTTGPASPGAVVDAIGEHLFGTDSAPVAGIYPGDLSTFVGQYTGAGRGTSMTARVSVNDKGELMIRTGGPAQQVEFLEGTTFFRGTTRYTFDLEDGAPVLLRVDVVYGYYILEADEMGEVEDGNTIAMILRQGSGEFGAERVEG